jgi:DNA-binding NarL/FixJ family response regulator
MHIKLTITDDHPVVTNGLVKIFKDFDYIEVLAVYNNGNELINGLKTLRPDILLLDLHLPDIEGPELATTILKLDPRAKIIVFSSSDNIFQVKKMLAIGCMGYLLKDSDDVTILQAIDTVYKGGQFLSSSLQQQILNDLFKTKTTDKKQVALTRREKEILQLITKEFTNQEIAAKLFISPHTVDNHRISLLHKLGVKNTAGLVRVAIENGLIDR